MKVLVTGAKGFIGRNLCAELENIRQGKVKHQGILTDITVLQFDIDTDPELLDEYCRDSDFVFHLAGVNRPENPDEFLTGNFRFTSTLLDMLKKHGNACPVMISSSTQAALDNPYGKSKKAGENLLFEYGKETGAKVYVYRFPNVFGKWCKPNYNSVVATFCHNISRDLPITVNDPSVQMNLVYIDDVVQELLRALSGNATIAECGFSGVPVVHSVKLGEIAELLHKFKSSRNDRSVHNTSDAFERKLCATYLSYLPGDSFSYPLKMNTDDRGSFTEILRTLDRGQFSVNISKPGIIKGNHWHHTKNEKFLVVSGKAVIRFRRIDREEIIEYHLSGDIMEVVDVPPGYTHNIENPGETDMVFFIWCNECFDPEYPDTYFLEV